MIAYRLTGSRCRCQTCGQYFNSVSVFDRHRIGPWTDRGAHRRCLAIEEMRARGWSLNVKGFWVERRMMRSGLDRTRRSGDRPSPATEGPPPQTEEPSRAVA
jgi:hypothetical protein